MGRAADEFHTLSPHLIVEGAAEAIEFYGRAFGAVELYRNAAPNPERIQHAEMLIGDSRFFVVDAFPEANVASPRHLGGTPVMLHLYVEDVDVIWERAVMAGAQVVLPLGDQFWGDRYGILLDPFGHRWSMASRVEDLSPAELQERAAEHNQRRRE